jgi:hypothetical protein
VAVFTLALDPPITDWARFTAWFTAMLVLAASPPPRSWRWLGVAALVCVAALAGRRLLPSLHIEEAHGHFVPVGAEPLQSWLPGPVYAALDTQFRERYPPDFWCEPTTAGCWRAFVAPRPPFVFSADAFLGDRRYSRVVDTIAFRGLGELRAGFTNRLETNWWDRSSDVRRRDLPFYVMYLLPAEAVGCELCWEGDLFWETADGVLDLSSATRACRTIEASGVSRRVFGVSVQHQPLGMWLTSTPALARWGLLRQIVSLTGVAAAMALLLRPRARRLALLVASAVAATAYMAGADMLASFARYDPIGGGSDGIPYESYGHTILERLEAGDLGEALKGVEPSFFFMPGLRYFRALEKAVFGETYLGYLAVLLMTPAVVWCLLRTVVPMAMAAVLWIAFLLPLPVVGRYWWSFASYVDLAQGGLAEPLAQVLWLAGAAFVIASLTEDASAGITAAAWGSFVLSLACLVRPNLLIASGLLLLVAGQRLWRVSGPRAIAALALAFTPFLWVPLHNFIYAGRLELAARVIGPATRTPPDVYVEALRGLFAGAGTGPAAQRIAAQLSLWLGWPDRAVALLAASLAVLPRMPIANRALLLAAIGLHPLLLFWEPQGRYSHLAWQVTLVAAVANVIVLTRPLARRAWARIRPSVPTAGPTRRQVALALIAGGVLLLAAEAGMRIAATPRPARSVAETGDRSYFFQRTDAFGFRGASLRRTPKCLSLTAVGGATTESSRLPDVETWPGRLEAELSGTFACVEVTNAGREGFSTFGIERLLRNVVLPVGQPELVVILGGLEDVGRDRATTAERALLWPRRLAAALIRRSALAEAVLAPPAERRNVVPSRFGEEISELPPSATDRAAAQERLVRHRQTYVPAYRQRLVDIVGQVRGGGAEPILVTQPALYGDATDPTTGIDLRTVPVEAAGVHGGLAWRILELYNDATRDLGRELQVQVIDLAVALPKDSRLYEDFVRLSAAGAAQSGQIIARELCPAAARRFPAQLTRGCP